MEHLNKMIASNLAGLRKSRGLSLDRTAELTGVSKAMLAQIEKGKSNPTVSTLWKIANGLQVSFSYFMKEDKVSFIKINKEDISAVEDEEGGYRVFPYFKFQPDRKFEIYTVELEPGCVHGAKTHLGEEYLLVREGALTVSLDGEEHQLKTGDALQFSANTMHSYENKAAGTASFFLLMYYPEPEA
ncbi:helix-turn-helix domain-containing protein [Terribacillus saccharophilus]|uniref:DNA-binding protein n=1 Tax=Terribacillus saccharophilus TaxID=361277 RepID=A0ABX4GYC5_9BACI|nr:helix-turn-helix domain-containing protein [Terribacillus saccharophilus]PAD35844.1 DNA-binding protein [Terribacillus saccharophilus]PAD96294.1 DNA-binding protein [Terribacillus saccharophilus]PAD99869.1 DNA-binding protein [Terribacillus saccharophilus]